MGGVQVRRKDPFPTGVGMNRQLHQSQLPMFPVPHRRGDEPLTFLLQAKRVIRSPQAWG